MDEINRKIAVRLLIDNARAAVGKQYIVISPLKMSNSVIEDWMTVLKMDDPERTQDEQTNLYIICEFTQTNYGQCTAVYVDKQRDGQNQYKSR